MYDLGRITVTADIRVDPSITTLEDIAHIECVVRAALTNAGYTPEEVGWFHTPLDDGR